MLTASLLLFIPLLLKMAGKADAFADIDFEEINDATNLQPDEIKCLKVDSSATSYTFRFNE